ncbi:MAG: mechanosensitive ion channel protein MscS, partial [Cyanobacteria bacterium P01_C01_bin.38]
MKKKLKLISKYFRPIKAVIIILMLIFSLQFSQAMAQSNQFATVAIDGKQLFRVSDTDGKPAKKRAEYINQILKDAVTSEKVPEIEVKEDDNYATIIVDGKTITVTARDVTSGESANNQ